MEAVKELSTEEKLNQLNSKLINIKASIYTGLFGSQPIKEPIDTLIFGYLVGFLSEKLNMKFSEEKLKELLNIYKQNAKTFKDLDSLLTQTIESFSESFYDQTNKIIDINKIDISNNYKVEENIEVQNVKCEICLNEYNVLNPKNYFLQCGCIAHDECFEAFITNSILEGNINVLCPLCKKGKITYNLIYQVLNSTKQDELKEIFKKLAPHKKGALLQRLVCPNIKCAFSGKGAVEGSKFTCPECKNEYCINCDEYWHIGYTCEEFKSKQKMIKDSVSNFLAIAKNRYKQCPKCHIWIDFEIQCENLFCICGYKFELYNNYNNYY